MTHFGRANYRATQPSWTPDGERLIFTFMWQSEGDADFPRTVAFIRPDETDFEVMQGDNAATHPRLQPMP